MARAFPPETEVPVLLFDVFSLLYRAVSLARIHRVLASAPIEPTGAHLEIYLVDAERTPTPRLRTALLVETGGQHKRWHPLPAH